jgi:hypothetical protein
MTSENNNNNDNNETTPTATSSSTHLLKKLLMLRIHHIQHHMHHTLQLQNSYKTTYPRNMVCFRYIIVNTLHKSDTKVNNNNNNNNFHTHSYKTTHISFPMLCDPYRIVAYNGSHKYTRFSVVCHEH